MKEQEVVLLSLLAVGILIWIVVAMRPRPEPDGPRWLILMY